MKTLLTIFIAVILLAMPSAVMAFEKIDAFQVNLQVNPDSSILVTEEIIYDFGADFRHGIFRDIPYKYERNNLNYNYRIEVLGVTDQSGRAYKYETSKQGGMYQIKIGDPDVTVTGQNLYRITYQVERSLNYFDDHDEIYWNVTGNGWDVPISLASATVKVPGQLEGPNMRVECFFGSLGSNQECSQATTGDSQAQFFQSNLNPTEGLTVVVGFPKGLVTNPSATEEIKNWLADNYTLFFIPLGFIGMFILWALKGRDPKPTIPEVAQYEVPNELTPIEAGYLLDEQNQNNEISAEIVFLATQGYLKIERIPKEGWFGKDDYKLTRLKLEDDGLSLYDRMLMKTLFVLGTDEVNLSTLKKKAKLSRSNFDLHIIGENLTKAGYYDKSPDKIRKVYMLIGGLLVFGVFQLFGWIDLGIALTVAVTAVSVFAFGYFMPRKTQKGSDAAQLVRGLKQYLSVAEKDRLEFHNDPKKDPKIFEKFLPYAIALGVSQQWSEKFEGIYQGSPKWYVDPSISHFSAIHLNNNLSSFTNGFGAMVVANSKPAGSGGSGLGGGGFSGGGGGGGGGGSW